MWEYHGLIDFPIAELLDDRLSLTLLERHLHPGGLHGPPAEAWRGGCAVDQGHVPACGCRACQGC
jgi:hypothetical protein